MLDKKILSLTFSFFLFFVSLKSAGFEENDLPQADLNSSFAAQNDPTGYQYLDQRDLEDLRALLENGRNYQASRRPTEAIPYYQEALKIDPSSIVAHFNLGTCYLQLKDYEQALSSYQRVVEIDSENAQAFFQIGLILTQKKDYQKSIESYSKAIKVKPNFYKAYYMRSIAKSKTYDFEGVIKDCSQALDLEPGYGEAFYGRAIAHYFLKNYQRAISDIEIARDLFQEKGKLKKEDKAEEVLENIKAITSTES